MGLEVYYSFLVGGLEQGCQRSGKMATKVQERRKWKDFQFSEGYFFLFENADS